jgi:hypothetical protein
MKDLKQTLEDLAERFEPPSDGFARYLRKHEQRRQQRQRLLAVTLSALVLAAGAIAGVEAFSGKTQTAFAGIRSFKAAATYSTTATQQECPALSKTPDNPNPYGSVLSTASGPAGSTVTISGHLPVLDEAGSYVGPGNPDISAYWNLDFDHWTSILTSPDSPSASVAESPVEHLGTYHVTGGCDFQMQVTVPSVPPGTYPIVLLYWYGGSGDGSGGSANLPVNFHVTAG